MAFRPLDSKELKQLFERKRVARSLSINIEKVEKEGFVCGIGEKTPIRNLEHFLGEPLLKEIEKDKADKKTRVRPVASWVSKEGKK